MHGSTFIAKATLPIACGAEWTLASSVPLDWCFDDAGRALVFGEIYAVSKSTLLKLDELEGYGMDRTDQTRPSYDRQERQMTAIGRKARYFGSGVNIQALVYLILRADAEKANKHIVGEGAATVTDVSARVLQDRVICGLHSQLHVLQQLKQLPHGK